MSKTNPIKVLALALLGGVLLSPVLLPGTVWALGTDAGSVISFGGDRGGAATYSAPVDADGDCVATFVAGAAQVAQVSTQTNRTVQPVFGGNTTRPVDQLGQPSITNDFLYQLTNSGNTADTYNLTITGTVYGPGASNWTTQITNLANGVITNSGVLAEDALFSFKVRVTPAGTGNAPDGSVMTYTLQMASAGGAAHTTYVSADTYTTFCGLGGTFSDAACLTISGANVTLTKALYAINDPRGLGQVVPGAVLSYATVVTNTGSGQADAVVVYDRLPLNTKLVYTGNLADGASINGATAGVEVSFDGNPPYSNYVTAVTGRPQAENVISVRYVIGTLTQNQGRTCRISVVVE